MEQTTNETTTIISPYLTAAEAAIYLRTTVQGIYSSENHPPRGASTVRSLLVGTA